MGILSLLQAAIQPAAAARVGYLQGQDRERDKQRVEAMQDNALRRQGILDQIRASLEKSQIDRNTAQADRYGRMNPADQTPAPRTITTDKGILQWDPVSGSYQPTGYSGPPKADAAPHTITTDKGIMQWDTTTHSYKPTGFKAPARPTRPLSNAQDRLDAKTALDEATKDVPRPSKVPANTRGTDAQGRAIMIANPARAKVEADSVAYDNSTLKPLRQHLLDVTVGDRVKLGGPGTAGRGAANRASAPSYSQNADQSKAMQDEFDAASADLNAVLSSSAPDPVKKQARALYDKQQATIAKKYGGIAPSSAPSSATSPNDNEDIEEL